MIINEQKQILIAPLDWGLGHTTRCVPIIHYLRSLGHSITFAGNEWQRKYINESFSGIETIHLEGYNIVYGKSVTGFMLSLFSQLPGLWRTIRKEHLWLTKLCAARKFDGIISDNRYGLFHVSIPCVIMTHQLQIQSGVSDIIDHTLRKIHYKYIDRFRQCWVIDVAGNINLSGKLAHPDLLPQHAKYIGWLSQMAAENIITHQEKYLLILLSGPEPQRSILSKLLWKQACAFNGKVIFVEGSNKTQEWTHKPEHISYYKLLTKNELQPLIKDASLIICRSGYSTLMDLVALNKKAILIPTPGQTEQEYLGKYLHQEGVFYCKRQNQFDLKEALTAIKSFPFKKILSVSAYNEYQPVLQEWLAQLE